MRYRDFSELEPALVWHHFERILSTPHPSTHEAALREYIVAFAREREIECEVDGVGNVILRKGATAGMESRKGIILQSHMDMVPEKSPEKVFDFERDPIDGYVDGEWVRADGTTLGADNGLGVASMLAIFEQEGLSHPSLEALFTINEERGMDGAFGLEAGVLRGDILLNLDTEDERELCIGCAGGLQITALLDYEMEPAPQGDDYLSRRISVEGLCGGHSGVQIHEQRGNANKLLFRLLRQTKLDIILVGVDGGTLHNAIPREAYVDILVHRDDLAYLEEQVSRYEKTLQSEYSAIEPDLRLSFVEVEYPEMVIEEDAAASLVWAIAGVRDGVAKMSYSIEGLVQSSSNLATVKCEESQFRVAISLRSSCESEITALADSIASVFELAGFDVVCEDGYPGWQPNIDSQILALMSESYRKMFGSEPHILAVHAGLECGIIGATYPHLDMISFGPTILSPHSPAECVDVASVERFYRLLIHTIENVPYKG